MACGCQHKSFAAWLAHNNYTKKLPAGSQRYNYVSLDNVGRTIVDYFKADNSRWNKQNMKEAIEEIKLSVQKAKKARKRPAVEEEDDEEEEEEEKEEKQKTAQQQKHEVISLLSPECSSISFDSLDLDLEREASPPKKRFSEEEKEVPASPASAAAYAAAVAGHQEAQSNPSPPSSPAAGAAGKAGEGEPPSWWLSFRMRCEALLGPYADDSAFGPVEHDMPEQAKLFLEKLRK
jgi:hypothetical protein